MATSTIPASTVTHRENSPEIAGDTVAVRAVAWAIPTNARTIVRSITVRLERRLRFSCCRLWANVCPSSKSESLRVGGPSEETLSLSTANPICLSLLAPLRTSPRLRPVLATRSKSESRDFSALMLGYFPCPPISYSASSTSSHIGSLIHNPAVGPLLKTNL